MSEATKLTNDEDRSGVAQCGSDVGVTATGTSLRFRIIAALCQQRSEVLDVVVRLADVERALFHGVELLYNNFLFFLISGLNPNEILQFSREEKLELTSICPRGFSSTNMMMRMRQKIPGIREHRT